MTGRRRRGQGGIEEFLFGDFARRQGATRPPDNGAGTDQFAIIPAIEHGSTRQDDGRDINGRGRHNAGRRGLVAAGGQHHGVDRIGVQDLDQSHHRQVTVDGGGRATAILEDRVDREFDADATGVTDAFTRALGQFHMDAVARAEITAGLGNADDRPAGAQLLRREAVVHETLQIERRHVDMTGGIEPFLRTETAIGCSGDALRLLFVVLRHGKSRSGPGPRYRSGR